MSAHSQFPYCVNRFPDSVAASLSHEILLLPDNDLVKACRFYILPSDPVEIVINHSPGTYYNSDFFHYDQYTGKLVPAQGSYEEKFKEVKLADKIVRMNYDIHVGAILGLPGKILTFFVSLIAASLPVTGFIIWWGRRKKKRTTDVMKKGEMPVQVV